MVKCDYRERDRVPEEWHDRIAKPPTPRHFPVTLPSELMRRAGLNPWAPRKEPPQGGSR